jgi:hypothetical protein
VRPSIVHGRTSATESQSPARLPDAEAGPPALSRPATLYVQPAGGQTDAKRRSGSKGSGAPAPIPERTPWSPPDPFAVGSGAAGGAASGAAGIAAAVLAILTALVLVPATRGRCVSLLTNPLRGAYAHSLPERPG